MVTQCEAIIEAFEALSGVRTIKEIEGWVNRKYRNRCPDRQKRVPLPSVLLNHRRSNSTLVLVSMSGWKEVPLSSSFIFRHSSTIGIKPILSE